MKINVQDELQKFAVARSNAKGEIEPDLATILGIITGYLHNLGDADWRVSRAVREIGPRLAAELNRLMAQRAPDQVAVHSENKKNNVLYAIYDQVESLLIVARANQKRQEIEIYQQLLDYVQIIYAKELNWVRMNSLGRTYNPNDYDGFVINDSGRCQREIVNKLEIVNELRAGFTCQGEIVRKPVVEFYE